MEKGIQRRQAHGAQGHSASRAVVRDVVTLQEQMVMSVLSMGASVFYLTPAMLCVPELEVRGRRIWKLAVPHK